MTDMTDICGRKFMGRFILSIMIAVMIIVMGVGQINGQDFGYSASHLTVPGVSNKGVTGSGPTSIGPSSGSVPGFLNVSTNGTTKTISGFASFDVKDVAVGDF